MAQLAAAADHMAISGIAAARRADSKIDGTGTATWLLSQASVLFRLICQRNT
jgi:hypothetical protein